MFPRFSHGKFWLLCGYTACSCVIEAVASVGKDVIPFSVVTQVREGKETGDVQRDKAKKEKETWLKTKKKNVIRSNGLLLW